MKIQFLTRSILPSTYANSVQVIKMCAAFSALGNAVELVAVAADEVRDDATILRSYAVSEPIALRLVKSGRGTNLRLVAHALRSAHGRPDVYFGRDPYQLLCKAGHGLPIIYETHSPPVSAARVLVERMLFRSPSFAGLVAISNKLKEYYQRAFPQLGSAILVAHDGADVQRPSSSTPARKPDAALHVGYVGSLQRGRGIGTILALARDWPELRFDIVGGNREQVRYWRDRSPTANVEFHGAKTQAELGELYARFDICVAPYERQVYIQGGHETSAWMSPMKLFEYMSFSKPMLASDLPAIREVLADGEDCLLAEPDDQRAWSSALGRLVESETLRRSLAEAALAKLRAKYTWSARARSILEAFGPGST